MEQGTGFGRAAEMAVQAIPGSPEICAMGDWG